MSKEQNILEKAEAYVFNLFKERLSEKFVYHDFNHTKEIVKVCKEICKHYDIDSHKAEKLLLAAWFHDTGYVSTYEGHEQESCKIAREFLQNEGEKDDVIEEIEKLIMATRFHHQPQGLLQEILHDADISHVGKKSFSTRADLLRLEWESVLKKTYDDDDWQQLQLKFLQACTFYTEYGIKEFGDGRAKNIEKQVKLLQKAEHQKSKESDPGRGVETMYRSIYRNHINLSSIADNKANMMISINTIIMSVIITVVGSGFTFSSTGTFDHLKFTVPIIILLISSLCSVIFAVLSASPNVTNGDGQPNKSSILFFGNFTTKSIQGFLDEVEALRSDKEKLYESMSVDIYNLGIVLTRKYKLLRISYLGFMAGLSLAVITFTCIYLSAYKG